MTSTRLAAVFALLTIGTAAHAQPLKNTAPVPNAQPVFNLGHRLAVVDLEFAPDGKTLASCGMDGIVNLWNPVNGGFIRAFQLEARVHDLDYSPSNGVLAGAGEEGSIHLWNSNGTLLRAFGGVPGKPGTTWYSVAFSPDGSLLATVRGDSSVYVWNPQTGTLRWTLKSTSERLVRVAFSRDGILGAGSLDGHIWLWNGKNGRQLRALDAGHAAVNNLKFSPKWRRLLSGGKNGHLFMHDPKTAKSDSATMPDLGDVRFIAFAPGDERVAFTNQRGDLTLLTTNDDQPPRILPAHKTDLAAWCAAFSPDGRSLVTGDWQGDIMLRDPRTGAIRKTLRAATIPRFTSFSSSPDGTRLAVGLEGLGSDAAAGGILLLDATGRVTRIFQAHKTRTGDAAVTPDNRLLVSVGGLAGERHLNLWDLQSGRRLWEKPAPGHGTLSFGPDGQTIALPERRFAVNYWNLKDGRFLREVAKKRVIRAPQPHKNEPTSTNLTLLPDGSFVTVEESFDTNSWNAQLVLWDGVTGEERYSVPLDSIALSSPTGQLLSQWYYPAPEKRVVSRLANSLDGRILALAFPGQLQIRDAATGELRRTIRLDSEKQPDFLTFNISTDGRKIVTNRGRIYDTVTGEQTGQFQYPILGGKYHTVFLFRVPGEAADRAVTMDTPGAIRFWDTSDGHLIATTQILSTAKTKSGHQAEWITYTPDGHYESSAGASTFFKWATLARRNAK